MISIINYFANEYSNKWFQMILKIPNLNGESICSNHNLTMKIIIDNPEFEWDWKILSDNPNIIIKQMLINNNNNEKWKWCFHDITMNKYITMDLIENNKDKEWCWEYMYRNPNLTIEFIKKNKEKLYEWHLISCHKNITMDDITNNPDLPWNERHVCNNPNLTMEYVNSIGRRNFGSWYVCSNPRITYNDIINNIDNYWTTSYFYKNPNLTKQMIEEILRQINVGRKNMVLFSFAKFSENPNLKINDVLDNLNENWDYYLIGLTAKFDFQLLINAIDKKSRNYERLVEGILQNPNLTFDDAFIFFDDIIIYLENGY